MQSNAPENNPANTTPTNTTPTSQTTSTVQNVGGNPDGVGESVSSTEQVQASPQQAVHPVINSQTGASSPKHGPSLLFYLMFGLTFFVFVGLVVVIVFSMQNGSKVKTSIVISPYPTSQQPAVNDMVKDKEASDASTTLLLEQKSSSEVKDIDEDLQKTDLSDLDKESQTISDSL